MWHCPRPTGANAASKLTRRRAGSRCQARSARCRMRHISPRRRPRRTDRCPCAGGEARRGEAVCLSVVSTRFFLFLFCLGFYGSVRSGYPLAAESVYSFFSFLCRCLANFYRIRARSFARDMGNLRQRGPTTDSAADTPRTMAEKKPVPLWAKIYMFVVFGAPIIVSSPPLSLWHLRRNQSSKTLSEENSTANVSHRCTFCRLLYSGGLSWAATFLTRVYLLRTRSVPATPSDVQS